MSDIKSSKTLIIIAGPTASGKTAAAVQAAKHFRCPVVSADSRQVFKEMKIGSARPGPEELENVPHYLLGHLSIETPYTASDFAKEARQILDELFDTNQYVIVCGGSGMYLQALLYGLDEIPDPDPGVRKALKEQLDEEGISSLQQLLKEKDPVYYDQVDINNPQRVVRALEVCLTTGKPFSSFRTGNTNPLPWKVIKTGIDLPREELYRRINERVDRMIKEGLTDEAKGLYLLRHLPPLNTIGYKELFDWMDGKYELKEAVEKIKQHTRNFAKRQMTWFKKMDLTWYPGAIALCEDLIKKLSIAVQDNERGH